MKAASPPDSWSDSLIGVANGSNAGQLRGIRRTHGLRVLGQRRHPERPLHADARAADRVAGAARGGGSRRHGRQRLHVQRCRHHAAPDAASGRRLQPDAVQLPAGAAGTLDAERVHALRVRPQGHGLPGVPLQQQPRRPAAHAGEHRRRLPVQHQQSRISTPTMRALLVQLDNAETGPRTLQQGPIAYTTTPSDGLRDPHGRAGAWWSCRSATTSTTTTSGAPPSASRAISAMSRTSSSAICRTTSTTASRVPKTAAARKARRRAAGTRRHCCRWARRAPVANIFGQNLSEAAVNAIKINATNTTNAEQQMVAATIGGEAFDLPAGAVGFSLGVEWRKAEAEYIPDEYLRSGDVIGFNPGLPTAGDVTSKDFFGEVRIPILADIAGHQEPAPPTAATAVRTTIWMAWVASRPICTVSTGASMNHSAFRGQFQRAIRAPNIGDLYGGLQLNFQTLTDPCSSRQQRRTRRRRCERCATPPACRRRRCSRAGVQPDNIIPTAPAAIVDLQEESSDTRTFGVVFTPEFLPDLAVTLDYFDIKLDGAIAQLGGGAQNTLNLCYLTVQDAASDFCQAVHRNHGHGRRSRCRSRSMCCRRTSARWRPRASTCSARYGWDVGWGGMATARAAASTSARRGRTRRSSRSRRCRPCRRTRTAAWAPTARPAVNRSRSSRASRASRGRTGPFGVSLRHRFIDSVTTRSVRAAEERRRSTAAGAGDDDQPEVRCAELRRSLVHLSTSASRPRSTRASNNVLDTDPPIVAGFGGYGNTFPATYDYAGMTMFLGFTVKTF